MLQHTKQSPDLGRVRAETRSGNDWAETLYPAAPAVVKASLLPLLPVFQGWPSEPEAVARLHVHGRDFL